MTPVRVILAVLLLFVLAGGATPAHAEKTRKLGEGDGVFRTH
jgi:hypothetical protein